MSNADRNGSRPLHRHDPTSPAHARLRPLASSGPLSRGRTARSLRLTLGMALGLGIALGFEASAGAAQSLPEGWKMRADRPDADASGLSVADMPPGYHVTTGPSGILWNPELEASGDYRIEAEIFLFDPGERRESFGFFVGGRDLEGDDQAYTYVLIRNGGEFIVKQRDGSEAPTIIGWTGHEAIRSFADRPAGDPSVRNVLVLERRGDELSYQVNGDEVARFDGAGLPLDGVVGLRVNHRLDLHVSRFEVTPLDQ